MENRHTLEDLKEMQNYPLEMKIALTNDRIRAWYREYNGNVFVSRSGGKDSDVLGDIVKKLYPDVPQVFINTGLEWDSVRKHGMEVADVVLYPKMNFLEIIKTYGYPVISKEVSQKVYEARKIRMDHAQKDSMIANIIGNIRSLAWKPMRGCWMLHLEYPMSAVIYRKRILPMLMRKKRVGKRL